MDRRELAQARRPGLEAQRAVVDGVDEARMVDRAVVALEVVLDRDLPVGAQLVRVAPAERERVDVEPVAGDDLREVAERGGERLGLGVGVDEDERPPGVDRDRQQAERVAVEAGLEVAARRGAQGAVEAVRPRVVRALQRPAPGRRRGDERAAVAADVDERRAACRRRRA